MNGRIALLLAFFWFTLYGSMNLAGEIVKENYAEMFVYSDSHMKIAARLGERKVILNDGQHGLKYFPDGAIAVVRSKPKYRILLAAGVSSYLLEGENMESLVPVNKVLAPGKKGSFDNGYAGINATYYHEESRELLALYHAEDQEQMGQSSHGIPGFYCSVGLAVSKDDGMTFAKLGPVITSHLPKNLNGPRDQGCGEVCICLDKSGRYLYAYYTEHSKINKRGVQICMARCLVNDMGRPGTWKKFYEGSFSQPGIGGKDTLIVTAQDIGADAIFPHVTYSEMLQKYVMILNINAYIEYTKGIKPEKSGIYVTFSDDGIQWSKPVKLITIYSIPLIDEEMGCHPTLIWSHTDNASAIGWLYYSYSERWGHRGGQKSHYMVGHPITFTIVK